MIFKLLINIRIASINRISRFESARPVNILLMNVKMSTIDSILTFMSRINFMLSCVEHEKKFYKLVARLYNLYCLIKITECKYELYFDSVISMSYRST